MKLQILLLAITAAVLSSCTTAYKTGQTPDDVYYSPARPQDEYVRVDDEEERYRYNDDYYDDRYLRMKVQNRSRWDNLDDWYAYDRYGYRYNYIYGSYYNPYTSWNYYYNPYCPNTVVVYNPKQTSNVTNIPKPRNFNLNSYTNTSYNTANNGVKMNSVKNGPRINRSVYNNTNSSNGLSNTIKNIFNSGGNNNSNNSSYSPPSRNYTPSSSGSSNSSGGSSGSSSGSSGGGASRPTRGGN
jgi:uncharacterized membrane protein YgcG